MDIVDRATRRLEAERSDPARLRTVVTWLAAALTVSSCTLAMVVGPDSTAPGVGPAALLAGALALRLDDRRRSWLLAATAAMLTLVSPDAVFLAPAAAATLALSVVSSHSRDLWIPWGACAGAAAASIWLWLGSFPVAVGAPFVAVGLGGAVGHLVRLTDRSGALEQQAGVLRDQATWLEQRTALARELHDVVGHHVTAMVVQAEAGRVGDARRALEEIGTLGRTALGELDALVVGLRDPDAPVAVSAPPRLSDIDELLAAPLRAQGVDVGVRVDADLGLDEVQVLTVYRIVQEALTNVARHARASAVRVEVLRLAEHLRVRVSDDGVGVPDHPGRGSGLTGIGERVAALGGFWELGDRLGGGTVLDVVVARAPAA